MLGYKEEKKNKIKIRKIKPTNINGFVFPPQNLDWSQVLNWQYWDCRESSFLS
jgi:hypothetical protein